MDIEELKAALQGFILQKLLPGEDPANVTYSTPLVTSGILDSIATLDLVSHLEESYGIKVEASEIGVDNLNSIDRIADFVLARAGAGSPE